ncbi:hypothetical protein RFI_10868 [Reticulomyxa filosa]|uniref:Uncharacterized protein n=1 Tax=Reticulomyxa filosa TaxID=46433 RepID=X6NKK3_RETFI|nr:hypothetical protein RFI_10868 [Reticulomyxa filosa]|eukprot:ETO26269.1 hypothetical protein RFI_10868 [Reticulomyxa filosa]
MTTLMNNFNQLMKLKNDAGQIPIETINYTSVATGNDLAAIQKYEKAFDEWSKIMVRLDDYDELREFLGVICGEYVDSSSVAFIDSKMTDDLLLATMDHPNAYASNKTNQKGDSLWSSSLSKARSFVTGNSASNAHNDYDNNSRANTENANGNSQSNPIYTGASIADQAKAFGRSTKQFLYFFVIDSLDKNLSLAITQLSACLQKYYVGLQLIRIILKKTNIKNLYWEMKKNKIKNKKSLQHFKTSDYISLIKSPNFNTRYLKFRLENVSDSCDTPRQKLEANRSAGLCLLINVSSKTEIKFKKKKGKIQKLNPPPKVMPSGCAKTKYRFIFFQPKYKGLGETRNTKVSDPPKNESVPLPGHDSEINTPNTFFYQLL